MKCVFNNQTGFIYAVISPDIGTAEFAAQFANSDWIDVEQAPPYNQYGEWSVDLETRQMVHNPPQ